MQVKVRSVGVAEVSLVKSRSKRGHVERAPGRKLKRTAPQARREGTSTQRRKEPQGKSSREGRIQKLKAKSAFKKGQRQRHPAASAEGRRGTMIVRISNHYKNKGK